MSPVRTCIGCRRAEPAGALVRLALVGGVVVVDRARRLPGRGAWIHGTPECVTAAERRRAWARAFRQSGPVEASAVRDALIAPL